MYAAAVADAFVRLHDEGLIYKGTYMVNWAPKLQTAVSDLEVDYTDEAGFLYVFKYPLAGDNTGKHLPVATTRPETILGDTAVAVHPEDPRYAEFVGKEVEVPMSGGRRIPVIADEYVDREFGTGALKITPAHDPNDYEIGQRVGLEMMCVMSRDGTMNAEAGAYAGMDRFDCRKTLWKDLEAADLAIRKEDYNTRCVFPAATVLDLHVFNAFDFSVLELVLTRPVRCCIRSCESVQVDTGLPRITSVPPTNYACIDGEISDVMILFMQRLLQMLAVWCRVPRSQRGGEVIEPMVSEQWFVRTEGMGAAALDAVNTGRMNIIPQRFTKIYNNWMEGIQDWCISRQLWWGHRIPVWYCFASAAEAEASEGRGEQYVVARTEEEAREKV